jgi:hypothetical protein
MFRVSFVLLTPFYPNFLILRIALLPFSEFFKNVTPANGEGVLHLKGIHNPLFFLIIQIITEFQVFQGVRSLDQSKIVVTQSFTASLQTVQF